MVGVLAMFWASVPFQHTHTHTRRGWIGAASEPAVEAAADVIFEALDSTQAGAAGSQRID